MQNVLRQRPWKISSWSVVNCYDSQHRSWSNKHGIYLYIHQYPEKVIEAYHASMYWPIAMILAICWHCSMQRFAGEIPTQNTAARLGRIRWGVRKGGGRICTKYRNTKTKQKRNISDKYNTPNAFFEPRSDSVFVFCLYNGVS